MAKVKVGEVKIGDPATIHVGSDSYGAVVSNFHDGPDGDVKRITVRRLAAYDVTKAVIEHRETGGYGWDRLIDVTHWSVELRDPVEFSLRKDGGYVEVGRNHHPRLSVGAAREYRDPSF